MNSRALIIGMVTLVASSAHAERLDTSSSLDSGQLSLAVEGQAASPGGHSGALRLHQGFGLAAGYDLVFRQALDWSGVSPRFDGALKYTLAEPSLSRSTPGVAVWVGGGFGESPFASVAMLLDFLVAKNRRVYGGLEVVVQRHVNLVFSGGIRFALSRHLSWYTEAGGGFDGRGWYYVSTGPRVAVF